MNRRGFFGTLLAAAAGPALVDVHREYFFFGGLWQPRPEVLRLSTTVDLYSLLLDNGWTHKTIMAGDPIPEPNATLIRKALASPLRAGGMRIGSTWEQA